MGARLDFLRELLFVLRNVPALAQRYKKRSVFAALTLCLSIGSMLAKHGLFATASTAQTVLQYIFWVGVGVTVLVFCLAFVDLIMNRLSFDDLVCTNVSVDAYYHVPSKGMYELVQHTHCCNRTGNPVSKLADVCDGYYQQLTSWAVKYSFKSASSAMLEIPTDPVREVIKNNYQSGEVYFYHESARFNPPLQHGETGDIAYRMSAALAQIEASAFTGNGTVFYRGVDYPTLRYFVTIHAPAGYEVECLEWGVIDAGGRKLTKQTDDQAEPKIAPSQALLQWSVSLPKKHLRYMLKFKFNDRKWT